MLPPDSPDNDEQLDRFFDELLDSSDPESLLASHPNLELAKAAAELWRHHKLAESESFLAQSPTLVRHLQGAAAPKFQPGQVLAERFQLIRFLGAGGMGEVYLAEDRKLTVKVAVKTIRGELAGEADIRARFLSEIQNARQVTHPCVCRIFELFQEQDSLFYTMEYLPGESLSEWLDNRPGQGREAGTIALQLAEGLHAAHMMGIIHRDFKPGNIILIRNAGVVQAKVTDFGLARALTSSDTPNVHSLAGGTWEYMAPELIAGGPATIQTDIYAFGKVLLEVLPKNRWAVVCQSKDPAERPKSLAPVIEGLRPGSNRRHWLVVLAASGFAIAGWGLLRPSRVAITGSHRLLLNGFRPDGAVRSGFLRELFATSLRQSSLLTIIPDDRVRALLRNLSKTPALPAQRSDLLAAAGRDRIGFILEGTVEESANRLQLSVYVVHAQSGEIVLRTNREVGDPGQAVRLAGETAMELRREFGESATALAASIPLELVTSSSPEAVDAWLHGKQDYEKTEVPAAIAWFERAVQIDPQFALAHMYRGLATGARFQTHTALASYAECFRLRHRVSERERLEIESRYYNATGDFYSSLTSAQRLVALFPEEATFQRQAAFALARNGRAASGLPHSFRAVELDPYSVNNLSEAIVNHVEANDWNQALELYRIYRAGGSTAPLLEWGRGLAQMGRGEYAEAEKSFQLMLVAGQMERGARLLTCGAQVMQGRIRQAAQVLRSDLAWDDATLQEMNRGSRRVSLAFTYLLLDERENARREAELLGTLEPSPAYLQFFREAALILSMTNDADTLAKTVDTLRQVESQWPSTHSRGARSMAEALSVISKNPEKGTSLFDEALGLWQDPVTLLAACLFHPGFRQPQTAAGWLDSLEKCRGKLFKHFFPALHVFVLLQRARHLAASQPAESRVLYQQVLRTLLPDGSAFAHAVQSEFRQIGKERHSMIDFWQIEGALLTNNDFAGEVFDAFPPGPQYPYDAGRCGFVIPEVDYDNVEKIVAQYVAGPVSLFALGETLVAIMRPGGRAAMEEVREELLKPGRLPGKLTPNFLVALGALVIDDIHSGAASGDPAGRAEHYGLQGEEIEKYIALSKSELLLKFAEHLCTACWSSGCFVKAVFYSDYTHPSRQPLVQPQSRLAPGRL